MPKVTKKGKEKKADFKKAKLKLGKGKVAPTNATNTSFKARSIALPAQNPLLRSLKQTEDEEAGAEIEDHDRIPQSKRGLTLPEVLITLRHPSAGARRDGLSELKDTLIDGAGGGVGFGRREAEVGRVVNGILRLVPDEDSSVRKALLVFLSWYLPLIPPSTLPPHLPLLLLQVSSALSHIFPEIRMDACRLVHLLLNLAPSQVVGEWPLTASTITANSENPSASSITSENNILEGLRLAAGIGGRTGEGGQNGLNLLPASKLVILRTMLAFVRRGLVKQGIPVPNSSDDASGGQTKANDLALPEEMFRAYEPEYRIADVATRHGRRGLAIEDLEEAHTLEGSLTGFRHDGLMGDDIGTAQSLGVLCGGADQEGADVGDVLSNLYLSLFPLLLSSLLEAAPVAFSHATSSQRNPAGPPDVNISLCLAIAELTSVLAGTVVERYRGSSRADEARKAMLTIVMKLSVYFPFGNQIGSSARGPSAETQEALDNLSLCYANLVILLPPRPTLLSPRQKSSNPRALELHVRAGFEAVVSPSQARGNGKEGKLVEEVAEWICTALDANVDVLSPALRPQTYASLLPSIWSLISSSAMLGSGKESIPGTILEAFLEHLLRSGVDSVTRRLANVFVMRMIVIHDEPAPVLPFYVPDPSPARNLLQQWLASLPRVLWETANKENSIALDILTFLRQLCQGRSSLFPQERVLELGPTIGPFFNFVHPSRGSIAGPWSRLTDKAIRLAALDLAAVMCSTKGSLGSEEPLARAVAVAVTGTFEEDYWVQRSQNLSL